MRTRRKPRRRRRTSRGGEGCDSVSRTGERVDAAGRTGAASAIGHGPAAHGDAGHRPKAFRQAGSGSAGAGREVRRGDVTRAKVDRRAHVGKGSGVGYRDGVGAAVVAGAPVASDGGEEQDNREASGLAKKAAYGTSIRQLRRSGGERPSYGDTAVCNPASVGFTGTMVPSALKVMRSMQTSRWVPSPPGILKRW
jgi:hypothetical protein